MLKKLLVVISLVIGLSAILVLAGCSSGNTSGVGTYPNGVIISTGTYPSTATTSTGTYQDVVITPTVTNDTVSIPVSTVKSNRNVHFELNSAGGTTSFEAYILNNEIQVRASYCVPCRGTSFTLSGDELICNNCGTVFNANNGIGIRGSASCQSYPKASVPFTVNGENIIMKISDLQNAFQNTLSQGLP